MSFRTVSMHGLLTADALSIDSPWQSTVAAHSEALTAELNRVAQKHEQIMADRNLSDEGRKSAVARLGAESHKNIQKAANTKYLLDELHAAKIATRIPTEAEWAKEQTIDPIVAHFQLSELRQKLSELDPVDLQMELDESAKKGDPTLLIAATGTHPLLSVASKAVLDEAIELYLQANIPESATLVREALGVMSSNSKQAGKEVERLTGVLPLVRDEIAEMAA